MKYAEEPDLGIPEEYQIPVEAAFELAKTRPANVELEQGDFQFIFLNPKDSTYQPPDDAAAPSKS